MKERLHFAIFVINKLVNQARTQMIYMNDYNDSNNDDDE